MGACSVGAAGEGQYLGADQEAEPELTVEEAYRGGRKHLTFAGAGERGYDVTIPHGVVDGQRIRLAGQGGMGSGNAQPGDLYLVVRIKPHPRYKLSGRDIQIELPVSPWEAALGATIPVRHLVVRSRCGSRPVRRPASGCGYAVRACRTPRESRAICTRRCE